MENYAVMSARFRNPRGNPGEDSDCEENSCGRGWTPQVQGEPRRGQRQRRKAHGNESRCAARPGSQIQGGTQARTTAARKTPVAMSACARRGWTPQVQGEPRRGQRQRRKAHGNESKCAARPGSQIQGGTQARTTAARKSMRQRVYLSSARLR